LRAVVEAVDPRVVVALDDEAAGDVARAYGLGALAPGVEVEASGRRLLAVSGLESALGDVSRKKIVWAQMQSARPDGPVY
jgi:hypothetical protein